jgi:hypothetical protein
VVEPLIRFQFLLVNVPEIDVFSGTPRKTLFYQLDFVHYAAKHNASAMRTMRSGGIFWCFRSGGECWKMSPTVLRHGYETALCAGYAAILTTVAASASRAFCSSLI